MPKNTHKLSRHLWVIGHLIAATGCATETTIVSARPDAVILTASTSTVQVGSTRQLTARVEAQKVALPGMRVEWNSSNTAVAIVDSNGLVAGQSRGNANITASVGIVRGTMTITVIGIQSISVTPSTMALRAGQTATLTATVDADVGVPTVVSWRSSDPAIAAITSSGVVTALSVGTTTISANVGSEKATAVITVVAAPSQIRLNSHGLLLFSGDTTSISAVIRDSKGNILEGLTTQYRSLNPDVAFISPKGTVGARATGQTLIIASLDDIADTLAIQVEPTDWTLIGHMKASGGMINATCDFAPSCSFGTFISSPSATSPDFIRPVPLTLGSLDILFVTGDRRVWSMTDYDSLQTLIVTKHGSEAPNLRFFSALDAAPSETIGNVLSRGSNVEDPWVVLRGSHVLGVNDGLVLYGEAGFSTPQYSKLKNSHGGINIFVRKRTNSR